MPDEAQLIYDWNTVDAPPRPAHPVSIHDETLRDGIQGPSVRDPDIEHKLRFLHLAEPLGNRSPPVSRLRLCRLAHEGHYARGYGENFKRRPLT